MDIDLVYLWVDGYDPQWQQKHNAFVPGRACTDEENGKGRYVSNDELKYSLRSVEKYAPWIRKIFIVTDNQIPEWLDTTNPKIRIIDHRQILPEEALPCFNSVVLECFLYKIPGLAEHFLYANDDMFFNADVTPDFFFGEDGFPIVRLGKPRAGRWRYWFKFLRPKDQYQITIHRTACLIEKKFGKYYGAWPHHNIDAYTKSDYAAVMGDIFRDEVEKTQAHHVRNIEDLQRSIVAFYALAIGHGHLKLLKLRQRHASMVINVAQAKLNYIEQLEQSMPTLFCLNDTQFATDEDRMNVKPFLVSLFPDKSKCEK